MTRNDPMHWLVAQVRVMDRKLGALEAAQAAFQRDLCRGEYAYGASSRDAASQGREEAPTPGPV